MDRPAPTAPALYTAQLSAGPALPHPSRSANHPSLCQFIRTPCARPSMAPSNKSQLRSLKKALTANGAPRNQAYAPNTLIAPSTMQSECSTLVDFGDEYLDEEQPEEDAASVLGSDNSAWLRSISTSSSSSAASASSAPRAAKRPETAVMLDSDDMSWSLPRDAKRSIPKRILHAFAGQ
ncbi:uncharacterized protein PHACADRAFT_135704 [Phanerochaete carnosa HHB-10118-sp]|uniref:Uncharacterized protein n=1 Tax=Phanerochaete carnosa (strain HHB-10118-sp) TaxID=650164 RepID=K5WRD3_PHACS|nr:uncharacterized protein PHACADRAFT_135704 [Phanerochaete carnosa HHB-10118-sp]EKM61794.1 hypothetical protein PHACADRAFT_135704 [Phanerochaete carnosa HHB-10118-sp]